VPHHENARFADGFSGEQLDFKYARMKAGVLRYLPSVSREGAASEEIYTVDTHRRDNKKEESVIVSSLGVRFRPLGVIG
jgi:hypothetical protein